MVTETFLDAIVDVLKASYELSMPLYRNRYEEDILGVEKSRERCCSLVLKGGREVKVLVWDSRGRLGRSCC